MKIPYIWRNYSHSVTEKVIAGSYRMLQEIPITNSIILKWFDSPVFSKSKTAEILSKIRKINDNIDNLKTELCYHVEFNKKNVEQNEKDALKWILSHPFNRKNLKAESQLKVKRNKGIIIECGPLFNFSTSDSTNAISICRSADINSIVRLESSKRYLLTWQDTKFRMTPEIENNILDLLYDKMTECQYTKDNIPVNSFNEKLQRKDDLFEINVMEEGKLALDRFNKEMGLAFDETDLDYYTNLFLKILGRNPTNIELFDLAQSNSEHCRHWFFKATLAVDGHPQQDSLLTMILESHKHSNPNSMERFCYKTGVIEGFSHETLWPSEVNMPCAMNKIQTKSHLVYAVQTHNFATAISPFSGAATGVGSRIRNLESVGRGAHCIAGIAGYCIGCVNIPGYELPWENHNQPYAENFALPLKILLRASRGTADYANKFGDSLIYGFVRSFGLMIESERREWVKPVMISAGIGTVPASTLEKHPPKEGLLIAKIGGPAYRIGFGGGSASSFGVQGDNLFERDFNAVQREDAELGQKLNRVVRSCFEMNDKNPILNIHSQGLGGNGRVLKELVYPAGGIIFADRFDLGDPTINALELWEAEYQESIAILCTHQGKSVIEEICARERVGVNFVGKITGDEHIVYALNEQKSAVPVNLNLKYIMGELPRKLFKIESKSHMPQRHSLPESATLKECLQRVLRHPTVCSKRFVTNKVDRSASGLIAQQQCCGPLQTPVADVAVVTLSHFGYTGLATAIGEQPIKCLVNSAAGARMSVGEALSNLVFAAITDIKDVKCVVNWNWPAKLPGEGKGLVDVCTATCNLLKELGIAINGGKDTLSMACRIGNDIVKAPGSVIISSYAPCPDIRKIVTPDLKAPSERKMGHLVFVDLFCGRRLGGSILLQCFQQIGDISPDCDQPNILFKAFNVTQKLIKEDKILAGHDVSDGGLITCLLEMAFAGMSGLHIEMHHKKGCPMDILFAEELGWVLEVNESDLKYVLNAFQQNAVPAFLIGNSIGYGMWSPIVFSVNKECCVDEKLYPLMQIWEDTNYHLELLQTRHICAQSEMEALQFRSEPKYRLSFNPDIETEVADVPIKVVVLREEGTNGDREAIASFVRAGFEVWDVAMQDLISEKITSLKDFRGLIFPGGFSYADVLGTAKGWAAGILFHPKIQNEFRTFFNRDDTFSFGICNGCQLMGMLGWIGYNPVLSEEDVPDVILNQNISERFECRFCTVTIEQSPSIMFRGMEGSTLGVWVAHGEGRFVFKNEQILDKAEKDRLVCLRYCDDNGNTTEAYPFNPSGSIRGIAGMCTTNGRHLGLMPHPERGDQMHLWPWLPRSWKTYKKSPWERLFKNAYDWCVETSVKDKSC